MSTFPQTDFRVQLPPFKSFVDPVGRDKYVFLSKLIIYACPMHVPGLPVSTKQSLSSSSANIVLDMTRSS